VPAGCAGAMLMLVRGWNDREACTSALACAMPPDAAATGLNCIMVVGGEQAYIRHLCLNTSSSKQNDLPMTFSLARFDTYVRDRQADRRAWTRSRVERGPVSRMSLLLILLDLM
jgi:hypothetical protein